MNTFWNTVPKPARVAAFVVFGLVVLMGTSAGLFQWMQSNHAMPFGPVIGICFGTLTGVFAGVWVLCLGYVYADARRRAMPPVLWTLIVALIPNLLGFLLYFALRRPIAAPCAKCGRAVAADQRFCSWCGYEAGGFAAGAPPSPPAQSSPAV